MYWSMPLPMKKNGELNKLPHIIFHRKSQQSKENEEMLLKKTSRKPWR